MKKRSKSLLALAVCVCMVGSSLSPVFASEQSPAPIAGEQTTAEPDSPEFAEGTDAALPSEETAETPGETEEPAEMPGETVEPMEAPEETAEPADAPAESQTPEKADVAALSELSDPNVEKTIRGIEGEDCPRADVFLPHERVTIEENGQNKIMKIDGFVPGDTGEMIVAVLREDGKAADYYAYKPKENEAPDGALCTDDVYNLDPTASDWYAFDKDGHMVRSATYVFSEKKNTYYFRKNGQKALNGKKGAQKVGDTYFWFKTKQGAINTSKTTLKKNLKDGSGNYTFYFEKGISVRSKLVTYQSHKYYLDGNGHMITGKKKISGYYYFFRTKKDGSNPAGSAVAGWNQEDKFWYFYNKKTCRRVLGPTIKKIGSKYYYIRDNGKVYKKGGRVEVGGAFYFFKKQTSSSKPYMLRNQWIKTGSTWYYALEDGRLAAGKQKIDNQKGRSAKKATYYFDKTTNKMLKSQEISGKGWLDETGRLITKGWLQMNGNWRYLIDGKFKKKGWVQTGGYYYYFKDGYLCQDLRKKYKNTSGSKFRLEVSRKTCTVTVLTQKNGKFVVPVVVFRCSVGLPGTPTPTGEYHTWRAPDGRWKLLMGPSWGQYGMGVVNGILFHSVSGPEPRRYDCVPRGAYNLLGSPASHGCIRLCVNDAKWLWDHVNGAEVHIFDKSTDLTKFSKPNLVPMKGSGAYGVDPTDPNVAGYTAPKHINPY